MLHFKMSHFKAKMHRFGFGWGSALTPLGKLIATPDFLAILRGSILLREGSGGEGKGKE